MARDFNERQIMHGHGGHMWFNRTKILTLQKVEVKIVGNCEDINASIYTFDASLKRRLKKFAEQYPERCHLESAAVLGAVTYVIDKARLSVRLVPPYSKVRRQKASEYANQNGYGSGRASSA